MSKINASHLKIQVKDIIESAVRNKIYRYRDLDLADKRILNAYFILCGDYSLSDMDFQDLIKRGIAQFILNPDSQFPLFSAIIRTFIMGNYPNEPYFLDIIENLLDEELNRQNAEPNEHFEHDLMQRIRDAKNDEKKPY